MLAVLTAHDGRKVRASDRRLRPLARHGQTDLVVLLAATAKKSWLFAGTLLAAQRAVAITSLIRSAILNGHDFYAYLEDLVTRLPTYLNSRIDELLLHFWAPAR
ncbi:hypothetical protein J2W32_003751 [Variovorax boronicumulans]|uniref:Transposase IS66 C-terminal domain-containing protein n=1 Tax=Variovorax boronicumulans TaxID=436515 RepID=A0AAW8D4Q5_9BURK|nr:hypothetical protein [Variovorax boronicumulans]MDQ0038481.1 hypothetical protein [Variovorax boronicumulans]MDQ0044644.1 hypothetical protein [Variovorax boronicumulans]MDQ0054693.1 hypothetical protein [Variovorax boronicumulans]